MLYVGDYDAHSVRAIDLSDDASVSTIVSQSAGVNSPMGVLADPSGVWLYFSSLLLSHVRVVQVRWETR